MAPSRREKKDETRRRLFAAARELFAERGYEGTTVDEIARRAGVAKGTFFLHYPAKDAVVTQLVAIQTHHAREARRAAMEKGPLAALRATVMALGREAGLSRGVSRAVLAATLERQEIGDVTSRLFDEIAAYMERDARSLGVRRPKHFVRGLVSAYLGAVLHFCTAQGTPPLEELLAPLVDNLLSTYEGKEHGTARPGSLGLARRLLERARPRSARRR